MLWDLFCRVIDHWGDIGVSWRLAADLAARGERVRLWTDDDRALAWMAPQGAAGVSVAAFDAAEQAEPGDVVIEAFGCDPPAGFLGRMAQAGTLWIDVEYLSAEPYVERSHALPSLQASGPAAGLTRWFFFPGFTLRTGGLLREPALHTAQAQFDAAAWRALHGLARREGERLVTLFCYANPALPALIDRLAAAPTLLAAAAGAAADQVRALLGATLSRGRLRAVAIPWLAQADFDRLLWASDLIFCRGEDSLVRAVWAARPFVWQAYPQADGAHERKVEALLDVALVGAPGNLAVQVRRLFRWWNGVGSRPEALPDPMAWAAQATRWADALRAQPDLTTRLLGFVAERR